MGNSQLSAAKKAKNDEFYTRMTDIEHELVHYKDHFKGKVVLCNCDDPFESNFFKYFALNFNHLGLKRLIATCYSSSPIAGGEYQPSLFDDDVDAATGRHRKAYKAVVNVIRDTTGDGGLDMDDIRNLLDFGENELTELHGDGTYGAGDFRSKECLELLDEADIVVTNPPFSLFREYVATLMEHEKKFVVLGNMNAITYKEVFPLLRDNKMWTGFKHFGGGMNMIQPKGSFDSTKTKSYEVDEKGNIIKNVMGVIWYTNLDIKNAMRTCSSTAVTPTTRRSIRNTITTTPSRCPKSKTSLRTTTASWACPSRSWIPTIPTSSSWWVAHITTDAPRNGQRIRIWHRPLAARTSTSAYSSAAAPDTMAPKLLAGSITLPPGGRRP